MMTIMQIIPTMSNGQDAVNFRNLKESNSLHLEDQTQGLTGSSQPGTPGLSIEDEFDGDLFEAFNSVTLHYDGES